MDISHLLQFKAKRIPKETVIFLPRYSQLYKERVTLSKLIHIIYMRNKLCKKPYKAEDGTIKDGCVNFGKHHCPPNAPIRTDILKKYENFLLVIAIFNFKQYKKEMRMLYPQKEFPFWTNNRIACCLYYQSQIKSKIHEFILQHYNFEDLFISGSGNLQYFSMEGVGMNVFLMAKKNQIRIKRNPQNIIRFFHLLVSNSSFKKLKQQTLVN